MPAVIVQEGRASRPEQGKFSVAAPLHEACCLPVGDTLHVRVSTQKFPPLIIWRVKRLPPKKTVPHCSQYNTSRTRCDGYAPPGSRQRIRLEPKSRPAFVPHPAHQDGIGSPALCRPKNPRHCGRTSASGTMEMEGPSVWSQSPRAIKRPLVANLSSSMRTGPKTPRAKRSTDTARPELPQKYRRLACGCRSWRSVRFHCRSQVSFGSSQGALPLSLPPELNRPHPIGSSARLPCFCMAANGARQ